MLETVIKSALFYTHPTYITAWQADVSIAADITFQGSLLLILLSSSHTSFCSYFFKEFPSTIPL